MKSLFDWAFSEIPTAFHELNNQPSRVIPAIANAEQYYGQGVSVSYWKKEGIFQPDTTGCAHVGEKLGKIMSGTADAILRPILHGKSFEHFLSVFVDDETNVVGIEMAIGDLSSVRLPWKEMVSRSAFYRASAVIFAHNHPSDDVRPSPSDIRVTKQAFDILEAFDILLLDHIIFGKTTGFFSFRQAGYI